jgi:hypothetical protein
MRVRLILRLVGWLLGCAGVLTTPAALAQWRIPQAIVAGELGARLIHQASAHDLRRVDAQLALDQ